MLRSMYSGINGMKNFQTKLDVIGNNISNVNTHGFKKGRTTFKDMVNQTMSNASASAPGANGTGGTNPKQVGLGAQLGAIDTVQTQGALQTTGRPLDLAISGDGFFQVTRDGNTFYTRAGNFYLDEAGTIVNSSGFKLVGPTAIPETAQSVSIAADGTVNYIAANGAAQTAGVIQVATFVNTEGLEKAGENLFQATDNSGVPVTGAGKMIAGALEMSNVDLSEEFTDMIVAQRGFQANTRIITTADEILQELMSLKR